MMPAISIAKILKPAALVDLNHRHAAVEMPTQHRIGAVIGGGDPARAGLLQLILRACGDLLVACLAADWIDAADQVPGRSDVIEKHADHEGDP